MGMVIQRNSTKKIIIKHHRNDIYFNQILVVLHNSQKFAIFALHFSEKNVIIYIQTFHL